MPVEKLKKIPIIGYIVRLIVALVKLPKHVDAVYALQERENILKHELEQAKHELEQTKHELEQTKQEQNQRVDLSDKQIIDLSEKQHQIMDRIDELKRWNMDRMADIRGVQKNVDDVYRNEQALERGLNVIIDEVKNFKNLNFKPEYLRELNQKLSENYTLWGKPEKLHISKLAAVPNCMFNTNSGEIFIGDYTFSGSGVSVLAGSHDKDLKGLLRRDVEIKEGCDVVIGSGVWLASNCTILGPAQIGDNSIIAAGAVVVPGTVVPANTIYGGTPAKCIGKLDIDETNDIQSYPIKKALDRHEGILYVDGWTETVQEEVQGGLITGHYVVKNPMILYTTKPQLQLEFFNLNKEWKGTEIIQYKINSGEVKSYNIGQTNGKLEISMMGVVGKKTGRYKIMINIAGWEDLSQKYFVTDI